MIVWNPQPVFSMKNLVVEMTDFIRFRRAFRRAVRWHGDRWNCFTKDTKVKIIEYWY